MKFENIVNRKGERVAFGFHACQDYWAQKRVFGQYLDFVSSNSSDIAHSTPRFLEIVQKPNFGPKFGPFCPNLGWEMFS